METIQSTELKGVSRKSVIAGNVINVICILFLLFDAIGKIVRESHSVSGSIALGWSDKAVQPIGITLLAVTLIYIIPKTKILGAILLTGYLGGAAATMFRTGQMNFFAVFFGILIWAGLFLGNKELRDLIPLVKKINKTIDRLATLKAVF